MPRLEDGQLIDSTNKFKKRRAWIVSDETVPPSPIKRERAVETAAEESPTRARLEQELNKNITRVQHDYNKSATRLKQDYNKTVTRSEQVSPNSHDDFLSSSTRLEQELNKTTTRVQHDYNKTTTRLEHDHNKTETAEGLSSFFAFIANQTLSFAIYEDDARWLLLSLSDVQKRMFWHVAISCINRGALRTSPIEIKSFFSPLGISTGVMRTTLHRLTEKRLLQREKGKLGKNGFAIISIPKTIHDAAKDIFANFEASQCT